MSARYRDVITEAVTDLVPVEDPIEALAASAHDPMAALAAWDVIRDPEFYDGLPPDDLENALAGLYAMAERPPEFASPEEIQEMIDHVEGLLGYELGEETIDIPLY